MQRINELFVEKATRVQALGNFGQVALEAFKLATESEESPLGELFSAMSSRLPDHYLNGCSIRDPRYKVVSFVDGQSLISMISEVEAFIQDTLVAVLCKYPEKLSKASLDIKKLLELGSIESAVFFAAQKHVNEVMYKRPNEYKKELLSMISAEEPLLADLWPSYVEAKARRDIGVHNAWKVNDIYLTKTREVGLVDPTTAELSVEVNYFLSTMKVALELMKRIRAHCEAKFA